MHELLPEEPETQEGGESEGEVTRNLYVRFYCLERARQKPVLSPPVRVHCVVFHQNAFHGFHPSTLRRRHCFVVLVR